MQTVDIFIERLNELLLGKSINAVAKDMGICQPTLYRYLKGERIPNIIALAKIADYFHTSADWLLGLKKYEDE